MLETLASIYMLETGYISEEKSVYYYSPNVDLAVTM